MPRLTRSPFYKRKSFLVLGIIFLLVMAGFIGFAVWRRENNKAIATDRARFEQAAKDVQTVADSINTALPPERQSVEKDCVYQSRDWAPKPIVCQVVYKSLYGVNDVEAANSIFGRNEGILHSESALLYESGKTEDSLNAPAVQKTSGVSVLYKDKASALICTQTYELYNSQSPPPYNSNDIASQAPLTLLNTLDCGGQAKSVHYPITN